MALYGVSILPLNHHHRHNFPILQNLNTFPFSPTPMKPPSTLFSSLCSTSSTSCSNFNKCCETIPIPIERRMFILSTFGFLLSFADQPFSRFLIFDKAMASQVLELDRYTDSKEGFSLLIPSSWNKVDKAGATVLFEDTNKKANNVGVVVSPTRISSLDEFGSPQFVADKLIQAERRKESTKEAEVISFSERSGPGGLLIYEFEYKVDSTRGGPKTIFSSAFVASKKLYLLNITQSDGSDSPMDMERRMILEQVLHSFDAIPST